MGRSPFFAQLISINNAELCLLSPCIPTKTKDLFQSIFISRTSRSQNQSHSPSQDTRSVNPAKASERIGPAFEDFIF